MMKLLKNNSLFAVLLSLFILIFLFLNLVLESHPILDLLKFLEAKKYYWTIPAGALLISGLFLLERYFRRKIIKERIEVYNATIHTLQDILHKTSSSLQVLILDMKDEGIREEFIRRTEINYEELNEIARVLASIDPENMQLKELNKNLSIIKMHEQNS